MATAGTAVRWLECRTAAGRTCPGSQMPGNKDSTYYRGNRKAERNISSEKSGEKTEKPATVTGTGAKKERKRKSIGPCSSPLHGPTIEKLSDCPTDSFSCLNAADCPWAALRKLKRQPSCPDGTDRKPAYFVANARPGEQSMDTHSCSAEQGNPVQNRNTAV